MSNTRTLSSMLQENDAPIAKLFRHCRLLQSLDEIIQQCLPAELAAHCRVLNYSGNRLILQTDSPAWNTLLRYQTPDLLSCLRRQDKLRGLASILIRTAPASPAPPPRQTAQPRQLSPEAATLIRTLAATMSDDRLQAALQRLAKHNARD